MSDRAKLKRERRQRGRRAHVVIAHVTVPIRQRRIPLVRPIIAPASEPPRAPDVPTLALPVRTLPVPAIPVPVAIAALRRALIGCVGVGTGVGAAVSAAVGASFAAGRVPFVRKLRREQRGGDS